MKKKLTVKRKSNLLVIKKLEAHNPQVKKNNQALKTEVVKLELVLKKVILKFDVLVMLR